MFDKHSYYLMTIYNNDLNAYVLPKAIIDGANRLNIEHLCLLQIAEGIQTQPKGNVVVYIKILTVMLDVLFP